MIATIRRQITQDAEALATWLLTRQYVRPHQPIGEVLRDAVDAGKVRAAVSYPTDVDPHRAIGRLRREELLRLSRSLVTATLGEQRQSTRELATASL